jgi:hypothetical protein
MVCPKSTPGREVEIHHIDCNSRNNNPTNLVEMSMSDHRALHREMGSYYLSRAWNTPASRDQLINGIRQYHASVTPEDKLMFKERGRKNGAKTWTNPETREKLQEVLKNNRNIIKERKSINYTTAMGERLIELYNNGFNTVHKMIAVLRDDEPYQTAFKEANQSLVKDRNRPFKSFPDSTRLGKILQTVGYNSWSEFKETYRYNHSITSIEWLSTTEDTGDITVSSINNNHNFALSSGVFVHNSEGRGSSVDTLPGGTALGEISDLKFFTNKLFRGLRIPSSYLPTGADDSQASFNDGRVGTAYIQELRFNKYCERLQTLITEKFDTEFKMYMYTRGLNVDANIFELQFNPPMNFASSRQSAVDAERINTFNTIQGVPYIAKRFALKRFLGLTDEELAENERLYGEESGSGRPTQTDAAGELRSAGLSAAEIEDELGGVEDLTVPEDLGILPDEEGTANNPPISP